MRGRSSLAVVLGSGLSRVAERKRELAGVPYAAIPGFGRTTVDGHPGRVSLRRIGSGVVLLFAGRFHVYEGRGPRVAAAPAFLAAALGCRRLVLTQAAGSLDKRLAPGSWMLPADIVMFPSKHGLEMGFPAGRASSGPGISGPGFSVPGPEAGAPSPSSAEGAIGDGRPASLAPLISEKLRADLREASREAGAAAEDGVLFWTPGPSYETSAEARAASVMGASAASMSCLPELVAARALGIESAVASWITNYTAPLASRRIDHEDVCRMGALGSASFERILVRLVERLGPG